MPLFFVSFSVADMNWTGEHRAFIVETFIKTNKSVTVTQRAFRLHCNLGRHDPLPARNTILLCVINFRASGSALKQKSTGPTSHRQNSRKCGSGKSFSSTVSTTFFANFFWKT